MQEIHDPARPIELPTGPFFVPPFEPETGGVDFLGLRSVNLELAFEALPGINNATTSLRPFSVIAWLFWKFHDLAARSGKRTFKDSELQGFQDKVETLFTWGHVLNQARGIPGTDAKPPAPAGGVVSLAFEDWKRSRQNTSLMAAVQYGPAAKADNGLGFISQSDDGALRTCGAGVRLAEALDSELRKRDSYRVLDTLKTSRASANEAKDLFAAWSILKPSAAERRAFRDVYFDRAAIGTDSNLGKRSETLSIAFEVLARATGPLNTDDVRESMVTRRVKGRALRLDEALTISWYRWAVLQLRQTQRLALEALLAWAEWQILAKGKHTTEELIDAAIKDVGRCTNPTLRGRTLGAAGHDLLATETTIANAFLAGLANPLYSIFRLRERLEESVGDECVNAVPLALHTLLLCARLTELFDQEQSARRLLRLGHTERISLHHWAATVRRLGGFSLRQALLHVFENFVLSQHFAVAVSRFDGRTQRLRITIEEEGLRPLVAEPWIPVVSPDRLRAALWLAADCGLIEGEDEGVFAAR